MFEAIAKQWQPVFGQLGGVMPAAGNDNGSPQYLQTNFGDLGFNGDPNNFNGSNGRNDQFLKDIGWTGGDPYFQGGGDGSESGRGLEQSYTPEFLQFLKDKGITFGQNEVNGKTLLQAFGPDGKEIGSPFQQGGVSSDPFGVAALAGAGFAGAAAAGVGAAGAGAGGSAGGGGLSAEQLAYGALENGASYGSGYGSALTASAEPGFGGALGEAGLEAGGAAGGSGAAADAAGMGLAEGAYPAGVGGSGGVMSQLGGYASDISSFAKQNPFLTNLAGTAVNGLIGAYSSNKALNRQTDATNQANALWAPYRETGTNALGRINGLMTNPSSITSDPGYQFQRDQGVQAIDRSAASKGNIYSGATLKALGRYGTDYAGTKLDQAYQRYGNVAQLGATGTQNTSNNLTNLGQAGAGAALYQGQVLNQGVNNALGSYNWANSGYPGQQPWNQSSYKP